MMNGAIFLQRPFCLLFFWEKTAAQPCAWCAGRRACGGLLFGPERVPVALAFFNNGVGACWYRRLGKRGDAELLLRHY